MKTTFQKVMYVLASASVMIMIVVVFVQGRRYQSNISVPAPVQNEAHSPMFITAMYEAARVYGKAGCGDEQLAEMTARHAITWNLPAALIAAQVATESNCNALAVSSKGAIGLRQIMPKVWMKKFDFTKINLFNPEDNMTVADQILTDYIHQYGSIRKGLTRYYGVGDDGIGLGGSGYADKVLALAGIK